MNNDELRELNKRRKIHQLAWVTRDLEKSMKAWVDNLKVGPWTVLTFTEKTLKYLDVDGKRVTEPFKFLIGISWIGEIQVELIQPVYGPMIYETFIQKHGEGLHHFKERVSQDDIDEVIKEYKEKRHRGDADRTIQRGLPLLSKHGTETGFCIGTGKLPSIEFAEGTSSQLIRRITGERTAELQDNPPASLVYMTGLEAVTFLEVIRAGYVHELTIFEPYLPDKGGYSCIYTRYGAGSRDAMSEHYVGVARPL